METGKKKKRIILGDLNNDFKHFDLENILKGVAKLSEAGFCRFAAGKKSPRGVTPNK